MNNKSSKNIFFLLKRIWQCLIFQALFILLFFSAKTYGNDICKPELRLAQGTRIEVLFSNSKLITDFHINLVNSDLNLGKKISEFRLDENNFLLEDTLWKGQLLGAHIPNNQVITGNLEKAGIKIKYKNNFYSRAFTNDKWHVSFQTFKKFDYFEIKKGTKLYDTHGNAYLKKGTNLNINIPQGTSLPLMLLNDELLKIVSDPSKKIHIKTITPARSPQGHRVIFEVNLNNYNIMENDINFCFRLHDVLGSNYVTGNDPVALKSTNQSKKYEVEIPEILNEFEIFELAKKVDVRLVGFSDKGNFLDAETSYFITSNCKGFLISIIITILAIFITSRFTLNKSITDLIKGKSGRWSLSNFQICIWSLLVFFSLTYVWLISGELIEITTGILVLLGISGGASATSRFVAATNMKNIKVSNEYTPITAIPIGQIGVTNLMQSDNTFDLSKFQMLLFTVFSFSYALFNIWALQSFPEIPESLLWLMGLSNGTYLAGKASKSNISNNSDNTAIYYNEYEKGLTKTNIKQLQQYLNIETNGKLNTLTRQKIKEFKISQGIVPVNAELNKLLFEKIVSNLKEPFTITNTEIDYNEINPENMSTNEILRIQKKLLPYSAKETGIWDENLIYAIKSYQKKLNIQETGKLTKQLYKQIFK